MFDGWMDESQPEAAWPNIAILTERDGARAAAMVAIRDAVRDHFYGADILGRLGFAKAARVLRENLPIAKRMRSADLGEMFATEYVIHRTEFDVPLKRLRYKDDRDMALRGTDVIAIRRHEGTIRVLKLEAKSRAALPSSVVGEACESLVGDECRPKPATLAFMARMLRYAGRDDEAREIEDLQTRSFKNEDIVHAVFVFCGNNPLKRLKKHADPKPPVADRRFVGMRVVDHQEFIASVFAMFDAPND